jgi:predicted amidohydrolase
MTVHPGDTSGNVARMLDYIHKASALGADIVVFPELATSGYVEDQRSCAEELAGETVSRVRDAARRGSVWVAIGLAELRDGDLYNSGILVSRRGEVVGSYSKTHLGLEPAAGSDVAEAEIFSAGSDYPVFSTDIGMVGMMICKDGLFPEVSRIYSVEGCEVLLWLNHRREMATCHLETTANVNRLVLVASNVAATLERDGGGSAIVYFEDRVLAGASGRAFRHRGAFLARAGKGETLLCADVDMEVARGRRKAWLAHWLNRRPHTYGPLTKVKNPVC